MGKNKNKEQKHIIKNRNVSVREQNKEQKYIGKKLK